MKTIKRVTLLSLVALVMIMTAMLICEVNVCYAEEPPAEVVAPEVVPPVEEVTPPTEEVAPPTEETPTEDSTADEWKTYIHDTIIPAVTLALTNLAGLIIMYLPAILTTLGSLKKIFVDWKGATTEIKAVLEANDKNVEMIVALEDKLNKANEFIDKLSGIVMTMDKKLTIAFANDDRLVANGIAREICAVDTKGVDNGENEEANE